MSEIDAAFARATSAGRAALIPYVTAGFPSPGDTVAMLRELGALADVLEVGVPFSDPLADGPVIQASTHRALQQGMTLARTLEAIDAARPASAVVLFSYLNPVLQYGVDRLLRDAASVGVDGILLTDLPTGGDRTIEDAIATSPLDLIRLVAPTTRDERLADAVAGAAGFIYLIARLGVTGVSAALDADLGASVARVKAATPLPVAVGFGVSTPEQVRTVAGLADGVVVGSALVDRIGRDGIGGGVALLRELRDALVHQPA